MKGTFFEAVGTGNVPLIFRYKGQETPITLTNVLHAPTAANNLISTGLLDIDGFFNLQGDRKMRIMWKHKTICSAEYRDNCYYFDATFPPFPERSTIQSAFLAATSRQASHAADIMTWFW